MNRLFVAFGFAVVSLVGISSSQAQHLHAHGGHYDVHQNVPHGHDAAGHLTDSSGHHINGDGRHTGATGVYENGSYSTPSYSSPIHNHYPSYSTPTYSTRTYVSPSYSTPSYSTPTYSSSPSIPYSTPSVVPSSSIGSVPPSMPSPSLVTSNKIPVVGGSSVPSTSGGQITLSNPRENGGAIRYMLNSYSYSINPGESQTVKLDREWVLKFENGLSKTVSYRLDEGKYEFTVSPQTGWDIARSQDDAPLAAPSLPQNTLPNSVPSALGMSPPPSTLP